MKMLTVGPEFLLWSELLALWAISTYGVSSDPLPEDRISNNVQRAKWKKIVIARSAVTALVTLVITGSFILSIWILVITSIQPWLRFKTPSHQTAEFETGMLVLYLLVSLALIRHFHFTLSHSVPTTLTAEQLSAISTLGATMLFVVRGGTYIVRGCLRKAGTLPMKAHPAGRGEIEIDISIGGSGAPRLASPLPEGGGSPESPSTEGANQIDVQEINRGRLIGNFERLLLTLMVATGSYAALAFLVAAKGLIRSHELEDRDFAEYFLVGSLSSVLVALCAGIALRFALLALWPSLLSLQMQAS
jgi:hypothetical protein